MTERILQCTQDIKLLITQTALFGRNNILTSRASAVKPMRRVCRECGRSLCNGQASYPESRRCGFEFSLVQEFSSQKASCKIRLLSSVYHDQLTPSISHTYLSQLCLAKSISEDRDSINSVKLFCLHTIPTATYFTLFSPFRRFQINLCTKGATVIGQKGGRVLLMYVYIGLQRKTYKHDVPSVTNAEEQT